jgi:hypothetical protein
VEVDFSNFLDSLAPTLVTYGVDPEHIAWPIEAAEVQLPINAAIPYGLVINELISNALKHACPDGVSGDGGQVADSGREYRTGLKVLFITGDAEKAAVANGFLRPGMNLLTKPFTLEALAGRIKEMINS